MLVLQGLDRTARLWRIVDGRCRRVAYETVARVRGGRKSTAALVTGAGYEQYDPRRRV